MITCPFKFPNFLKERAVSSRMMLLDLMRGWGTALRVLVLLLLHPSWTTNWSLQVLSYYLQRCLILATISSAITFLYLYLASLSKNRNLLHDSVTPLSELEAIELLKTSFASATERDIYTVSLGSFMCTLISFFFFFICHNFKQDMLLHSSWGSCWCLFLLFFWNC